MNFLIILCTFILSFQLYSQSFDLSYFAQNVCANKNGKVICGGNKELSKKYRLKSTKVTSFAIGFGTGCAIIKNNQLKCWGYPKNKIISHQPRKNKGYTKVVVSRLHACAIKNEKLDCWGINFNNFGYTLVPKGLQNVKDVFQSDFNTCALLNNSQLKCWGADFSGLNDPLLKSVRHLAMQSSKACGIDQSSQLICWGIAFSSEERKKIQLHFQDFLSAHKLSQIAMGVDNICLVAHTGEIKCYGGNTFGNLDIPANLPQVKKLAISSASSKGICAQHTKGFTCWGGAGSWSKNVTRFLNSIL